MSFDSDSVTRGFNIQKYKKHTLVSREVIFKKYNSKMDKNFYLYSLKSLVMNYLVNKNSKKKVLSIIYDNISILKKNIFFLTQVFILLFFPSEFLIFLKSKIKLLKNKRY